LKAYKAQTTAMMKAALTHALTAAIADTVTNDPAALVAILTGTDEAAANNEMKRIMDKTTVIHKADGSENGAAQAYGRFVKAVKLGFVERA
jgi:phenylpyruvate tautomerase PptA (4-oxalocrotonate tautomerase family)